MLILEHKSIITSGYSCVLHIHAAVEEVAVKVSKSSLCAEKSPQFYLLLRTWAPQEQHRVPCVELRAEENTERAEDNLLRADHEFKNVEDYSKVEGTTTSEESNN